MPKPAVAGLTVAVPNYTRDMVRRPAPEGACVVPGSTPVVSFGDPGRAEVATLGINPSQAEFLADGEMLIGADRRLATLESLGASDTTGLSDAQIAQVLDDCSAYFSTNPYWRWFKPLNDVIEAGLGVSYSAGSACHLDLVQWATDPVWGKIDSPTARQQLLDEGAEFLERQLRTESIETVVVNGGGVWDQLRASGLADFEDVGVLEIGRKGANEVPHRRRMRGAVRRLDAEPSEQLGCPRRGQLGPR